MLPAGVGAAAYHEEGIRPGRLWGLLQEEGGGRWASGALFFPVPPNLFIQASVWKAPAISVCYHLAAIASAKVSFTPRTGWEWVAPAQKAALY